MLFFGCQNVTIHLYVSPLGDNTNTGRKEVPFKTLKKALEKVLSLDKSENENINIHLLEGTYHVASTLEINTQLNNISIIGERADKIFIKGSKVIDAKWESFSDQYPEIVEKLSKQLEWAKKDIGEENKRGINARPLGNEPYFTTNNLIPSK